MKKTIVFLVAILSSTLAFSQIGLRANVLKNDGPTWMILDQQSGVQTDQAIPEKGFSFGIDYWFRLKNQRIEFFPEINYASFSEDIGNTFSANGDYFSFFLNTQIYFLDFVGDCDCPTFSKDGTFLDKGLFLLLSPGISYIDNRIEVVEGDNFQSNTWAPSMAAGLGLDIGITDLITITPFGGVRYYFNTSLQQFEGQEYLVNDRVYRLQNEENQMLKLFGGLRLGFRFDE